MNPNHDVTIVAYRDDQVQPHGIRFKMYNGPAQGEPIDRLVSDKGNAMPKDQPHIVTFRLENKAGADLRFLKDPDEVLWIAAGDENNAPPCPEKSDRDADFSVVGSVTNDKLVVRNQNSRICKHSFALNFIGTNAAGKTAMIAYDPPWENNNGGAR